MRSTHFSCFPSPTEGTRLPHEKIVSTHNVLRLLETMAAGFQSSPPAYIHTYRQDGAS